MTRFLAALFFGWALALGLLANAHATDWSAVEADLKKVVASPEFVEAVLDRYKFQGATRAAMRTHLSDLYRSDEVVKALVSEMRNLGFDTKAELYGDSPLKFGQKFGAELFQSWAMKGMARLSSSDQRNFYRYILRWMTVATPADCKQMITSEGKSALDDGRLEMKYFSRLSEGELEAYLALMRKSIFAELRDFPTSKSLNGNQLQIADKSFEAKFEEMIRNEHTSADVLMAIADMETAQAQVACEAGKLIFRTLLSMKGTAADWMVLKMVLSAQ